MCWRRLAVLVLLGLTAGCDELAGEQEEVTAYPVGCVNGYVSGGVCWGDRVYPLNESRYKASAATQIVIWSADGGFMDKLNDTFSCVVRNGRNWSCRDAEEGTWITMEDGIVSESHPNTASSEGKPIEGTLYVSAWKWHCLRNLPNWRCGIPQFPLTSLDANVRQFLQQEANTPAKMAARMLRLNRK